MNQLDLFTDQKSLEPRDPHLTPEEQPRLRGQNARILERLREGRASNDELAMLARKYTSRISDLRAAGYEVRCVDLDHGTGEAWYELLE